MGRLFLWAEYFSGQYIYMGKVFTGFEYVDYLKKLELLKTRNCDTVQNPQLDFGNLDKRQVILKCFAMNIRNSEI